MPGTSTTASQHREGGDRSGHTAPVGDRLAIVVVSRHPFARESLRVRLAAEKDFSVRVEDGDGESALVRAFERHPDVVVLDRVAVVPACLDALERLTAGNGAVRPVLITGALDTPSVVELLQCGVRGVIRSDRPGEYLVKCLRKVHAGEVWIGRGATAEIVTALAAGGRAGRTNGRRDFGLTLREQQILRLAADGATTREIAEQLLIGPSTVKQYLTKMFAKVGVSNRVGLVRLAIRHQLVP